MFLCAGDASFGAQLAHNRTIVYALPMNTQRFIGYVRVSTSGQGASGLGVAAQSRLIESYCQGNGIELAEQIVEIDSAVSGERPQRFDALSRCAAGEFDGIIVAAQSRISRSVIETAQLLDWAERKGVRIVMLDCNVDTGTAAGRMVASVMASVAQYEADLVGERTKAALAAKRERGEVPNGRPETDQGTRQLIKRLRGDGLSLRAVATELNRRGIPTPRGGECWRVSSVNSALGYRQPKRRRVAGLPA